MKAAITNDLDWSAVFTRYEKSGLTQTAFCDQEGIAFHRFKKHRSKYLQDKKHSLRFASVKIRSQTLYDIELQLSEGGCMRFNMRTPVDYIKRLLQVL